MGGILNNRDSLVPGRSEFARRRRGGWGSIKYRSLIFALAISLVVIFVFEEAVYGRLHLGTAQYLIAKTASELILYLTLFLVLLDQSSQARLWSYRPTGFDLCLILFVTMAAISTVLNGGDEFRALLTVRTMFRYVAVFYIIVFANWIPTETQARRLLLIVTGIGILQALLIVLQHYMGDAFRDRFFAPPTYELQLSGVQAVLGGMPTKLGAGFGTFGKTPLAAFYLLFAVVVSVTTAFVQRGGKAKRWWGAYIVLLVGIFFTYKRSAFLLALLVPLLSAFVCRRWNFVKAYFVAVTLLVPIVFLALLQIRPADYVKEKQTQISPAESLAQLASDKYWEIVSSQSRGWVVVQVGREALSSLKPLGNGADEERAKELLARKGGEFGKLVGWGALDDVYVVAALVYFGPVGLLILLAGFYSIFRRSAFGRSCSGDNLRVMCLSVSVVTFLMFLAAFVVRVLEFRAFIFLFWVFAGVAVNCSRVRYLVVLPTCGAIVTSCNRRGASGIA